MPELNRTASTTPAFDIDLAVGLGEFLTGRDGHSPVPSPAPSPTPRRRDGRLLAQMAAARARRNTPSTRNLPRRGGY
ncbi:hypothetical protein [Streptomyces sp. NPDC001933]|uniref:hypothetical protein n=1 Tax=Streptomyces sp. NPDC001933 TaxID=3364626 RepID=UPI0036B48393